jgi:hypothetical protein
VCTVEEVGEKGKSWRSGRHYIDGEHQFYKVLRIFPLIPSGNRSVTADAFEWLEEAAP